MITRYAFPIPDYYGKDISEQYIYFEGDECPTLEEVRQALQDLDAADLVAANKGYGPYLATHKHCLMCLDNLKGEFPRIYGSVVQTNSFVKPYPAVAKIMGDRTHLSLLVHRIDPIKIGTR